RMGVDLRQRLLDFHAAYYSSDIMRLVIVGRDSLDQLTEWTVAKFSPIPSKGLTKPLFKGHPLTPAEMGQLVRFRSVRQQRSLDMTFALPDVKPYYQQKPAHYIGSLLGHEGPGSILSYLKKRGWATGTVAGRSPMSAEGFDMFSVSISLTAAGMAQYTEVVRVVFAYIRLLQDKGPQRYFYDELQRIGEIEYRFMEKSEAVALASNLAATMQNRYLPPEGTLSEGMLLGDFDADLLSWVQGFLNPDNVRILLSAHDVSGELDRTEKYYDISYRTDPLPDDLLRAIRGGLAYDELHLPEPNAFIPDDLSIKSPRRPGAVPTDEPILLRRSEGQELWFKQDDRFFLPRGNIRVLIETPRAYESPLNSVLNQLFTWILRDTLAELTYDAAVAGLWFDVRDTTDGIMVQIDGFNDKMARLLRILIETLTSHRVDDTQFAVYSREVRKKLDNARHMEPYNHAQSNTNFLNQSIMWRYSDKLHVFGMVTKERLQRFIDSLFDETRSLMLVTGNIAEAEALAAADTVADILGSRPLPQYARRVIRSMLHAPGRYMHHALMPERDNVNSCADVSVYVGLSDDRHERVLLDLLAVVLHEPFFDQLRTKEQLGYITYSTSRKYNGGQMALRLLVQSEASPLYLSQRIDSFMGGFRARLVELTQERFESYVNSLRVTLEEKLKNLSDESSRYWGQLSSGYYEFDRIACKLRTLAGLGKSDLLVYWDRYVNPDTAPAYTCLVMTMWSTRITQPTMAELARFPEPAIALHGCLEHDGARGLSLEAVAALVRKLGAGRASHDEDAALERLLEAFVDTVDDPKAEEVTKALDKIRKPASYVRMALAAALRDAASPAAAPAAMATNGSGSGCAKTGAASCACAGTSDPN
ncbi:metalloprotease, partial [Coemansia nantahalensis]